MNATRDEPTARRGRPPDQDVLRRLHSATIQLLVVRDYSSLSIEEIAASAGVAKTTIYRRGLTKSQLVVGALAQLSGEASFPTLTGDPVADLRTHVRYLSEILIRSETGAVVRAVLVEAARNPDLGDELRPYFIGNRSHLVGELISNALAAVGPLNEEERNQLSVMIIGPVLYHMLVTGQPLDDESADRVVDVVVAGWTALRRPPGGTNSIGSRP